MPAVAPLPLFPLGTVLLPGLPLELQVFEPRYVILLSDLSRLPRDQREFGVVAIRSGFEVGSENLHEFLEVGTVARIEHATPVGRQFTVQAVGIRRFRVQSILDAGTPYLTAAVSEIVDRPEPGLEGGADRTGVAAATDRLRSSVGTYIEAIGRQAPPLPDDPNVLCWWAAAVLAPDLDRQHDLLASTSLAGRLDSLANWLSAEVRLMRGTASVPFRAHLEPPSN